MCEAERAQLIRELKRILDDLRLRLGVYKAIRRAFASEYGLPELDLIRHEICLCLILGLDQAALTLTNHLLESLLKYALIYYEADRTTAKRRVPKGQAVQSLVELTAPALRKYGDKDLSHNINSACRVGLITKDQKKELHRYREIFRNAWSHSDKNKTFGSASVEVRALRIEGGKLVSDSDGQVPISDLLMFHGIAQVMVARENALPYFLQIDGIARQVLAKVFPSAQQT